MLLLASYSARDILWLRALTVVAGFLLVPYYVFQSTLPVVPLSWNAVFIAINVYWVARLLYERRPVELTPDEARLRVLSFPSLTPQQARNLFAMGIWDNVAAGDSLVRHDNDNDRFSVILRGLADVIHEGTKIAELGEGQFVGTIDARAREIDVDVFVRRDVRVMCWPRGQLSRFLADRPDAALALERSVGLEIQHTLGSTLSVIDRSR